MGIALACHSAAAQRVYDMAEKIRPGTFSQLQNMDKAELSITKNAQPCLFCVDLAAAEALCENGIVPDMVAGFSLGEIPALAFTGIVSWEEAFKLVLTRANEMQACAEETQGGMAAILGLDAHKVEEICRKTGAFPANYNCPGQIVIAAENEALQLAAQAVKEAGGKVMLLNVSGAFHTPYMQKAADALKMQLKTCTLSEPEIPLYSNVTGEIYRAPYAELIANQATSSVRFQSIVENMAANGVDTFIEVGIGKTLCGLIQKTIKDAQTLSVTDVQSLEGAIAMLKGENHA